VSRSSVATFNPALSGIQLEYNNYYFINN